MKEDGRQFEEMLKKAVCSYHEGEMQALPDEKELEEMGPLSDAFYDKMDSLVKRQKLFSFRRFAKYAAAAAIVLVLASGTVGMAAYTLIGAENFREIFQRYVRNCPVQDSAVMDLEQLQDMAVTCTGTVYENDDIRLEVAGLIKSGNMLSMILKGTLKQMDSVVVPDGPQDAHCYGFLNQSIEAGGDYGSSSTCYYQEDDERLGANQFIYLINYTSDNGFDEKSYTFTFEDFGYYQSDCIYETEILEDAPEAAASSSAVSSEICEETVIATCSGTWEFSVDMDQAKDISFEREYNITADDGGSEILIETIRLSPLGCSVYMTGEYDAQAEGYGESCFENARIRLKNGTYLDDSCYDLEMSESMITEEKDGSETAPDISERELHFEFHVPVDIRKIAAVEIFGAECEITEPDHILREE